MLLPMQMFLHRTRGSRWFSFLFYEEFIYLKNSGKGINTLCESRAAIVRFYVAILTRIDLV